MEDAVVARRAIVARETVPFPVLGEPVDEQIPVAPVADRVRGYPLQPLNVAARVDDGSVVALGDRCATDHDAPSVSRSPRKSGSSRTAAPSVGAGAPPRLAQYTSIPTRAAPPTSWAEPATKSTSAGSRPSRSSAIR